MIDNDGPTRKLSFANRCASFDRLWRYAAGMKNPKTRAIFFLMTLGLLGGCGSVATRIDQPVDLPEPTPQVTEDSHYEASIERGPEYIDALRAAPPPEQPIVVEGKNERGDQRELASKGFVRIGNGRYAADDDESVRDAVELGKTIGADQIWLYRHHPVDDRQDSSEQFLAAYYVRFKLLFGATFRNLTAKERETLELEGGVQIGSVVGGTPASQANLLAGDYVIAVNGTPIVDRGQFQELLKREAGKPVTLRIIRNQQQSDRMVRLGAMPPVIK